MELTNHSILICVLASCESNIKILSGISQSDDATFDLACIRNRLDSLIPILESTEKVIRMEYLPLLSGSKEKVSPSIKRILPSLEEVSLKLWNILNIKQKESEELDEEGSTVKPWKSEFKKLMGLKYFVSLLLSLFAQLDVLNDKCKILSLKCLLRTYYDCIDVNNLELGKQVKEYVEKLCAYYDNNELGEEEKGYYETLKLEFLILDMQSSLLSKNISMAKFYENKANIVGKCSTMKPENLFNICRTLYNEGLKLYKEEQYYDSHYFLQRCYLILEKLNNFKDSSAESKIKVSTLIMLAKCCMKINSEESFIEARKLLKLLQLNENEKIEALKLQIELVDHQKLVNSEAGDLIMKTVITISSDVEILKQIMMVLNAYSGKRPTTAKNCLFYVFTNKIDFQNQKFREIIESYLISLLWIVTSQLKAESSLEKLNVAKNILEVGDRKLTFELSIDSANCLVIMLWSLGKKKMKEEKFKEALQWFECCFVRFLNKSKESQQDTIGKIQRCILQCCLKLHDNGTFENTLRSMSELSKKNPITLYYQFVNMLENHGKEIDKDVVLELLTALSQFNDSRTINLLALCVVESKNYLDSNSYDKDQPFLDEPLKQAITKLLNKCNTVGTRSCDSLVFVALRASVYIYGKNFENGLKKGDPKRMSVENVEMIEKSVDQFLYFAKENRKENNVTDINNDIEWFSSTCFNYGLLLLENNIFDIRGGKLFACTGRLIGSLDESDEKIKNKFLKWKCKSALFQSFCERELIRQHSDHLKEKWTEIRARNQTVTEQIDTAQNDKEYKDIRFQSILLINESLIICNEWTSLIKRIKYMNEYGKSYTEDNQEIDAMLENIFDQTPEDDTKERDPMIRVLDAIFVERGFKSEFCVGTRMLFKWLHLMLTKMIENAACENKQLCYIRMFQGILAGTPSDSAGRLKDFEIEWLAGVCWNKGIKIILRSKASPETADDEDVGMENSFLNDDKEASAATVADPGRSMPGGNGLPWCEVAIAISGISSGELQCAGMKSLLAKLVRESAVSGGFSASGKNPQPE